MTERQRQEHHLLSLRNKLASTLLGKSGNTTFVQSVCHQLDTAAPEERPALIESNFGMLMLDRTRPMLRQIELAEKELNLL